MSRVLTPETGPIRGRIHYHDTRDNDGKGWGVTYETLQALVDDNKAGTAMIEVRYPFVGTVLMYHGKMMIPEFKWWRREEE